MEWVFLGFLVVAFFLSSCIVGWVSLFQIGALRKRIGDLETAVRQLYARMDAVAEMPIAVSSVSGEIPSPAAMPLPEALPSEVPPVVESLREDIPGLEQREPVSGPDVPAVAEEAVPPAAPLKETPSQNFEEVFGTKWLLWAGMSLILFGVAFFVKYAYDNAWIGPQGRLAIGTGWGLVALALGERFRRKKWNPLFQALTGGGYAIFYICIFFSFQIYKLSGQGVSFGLASLVTLLTVALGVVHNAMPVGVLALIGGFLSPVLLSTGENHPYGLFSYVLILDLLALGSAFYRKWRTLNFLAFAGTALMYTGWFVKYYWHSPDNGQMMPALFFATVFYVLFLAIPSLYQLLRKEGPDESGMALIALNALFAFSCYCRILYEPYRQALGFVILGQALIMFGLFQLWRLRLPRDRASNETLLVITLALVIIALPMHLRFYGIALGWAVEGVLFLYLGARFGRVVLRLGGTAALALSVVKLFDQLPLHSNPFLPVFNAPFGSWMFVGVCLLGGAWWLRFKTDAVRVPDAPAFAGVLFLAGYGVLTLLFNLETLGYWDTLIKMNTMESSEYPAQLISSLRSARMDAVCVLWAILILLTGVLAVRATGKKAGEGGTIVSVGAQLLLAFYLFAGGVVFLVGFDIYHNLTHSPFLINGNFLSRLALLASFWGVSILLRRNALSVQSEAVSLAGHAMFTILIAAEVMRSVEGPEFISRKMAVSLISAAWGAQAFGLVLWGLLFRRASLRVLGFLLFGITVGKVFLVDMSELDKVYRIVSFLGLGFCLVLAGYCYQRFSGLIKPIALLAVCLGFAGAAQAEGGYDKWSVRADVSVARAVSGAVKDERGFVKLPLSPEALDKSRPGLEDLRIVDAGNALVPYQLFWQPPVEAGKTVWLAARLRNQTWRPGQFARAELDLGGKTDKTVVKLHMSGVNFRRKGMVESSADGINWERAGVEQFLFSVDQGGRRFQADTLRFPVNNAPFLRVTVFCMPDDPEKIEISSAEYAFEKPRVEMDALDYPKFQVAMRRLEKTKETVLDLDLGFRNIPLKSILLDVSDPYFYRAWTLEGRNSLSEKVERHTETETRLAERETPWQTLGSGFIYRIQEDATSRTSTRIDCSGGHCRYLRLTIFDADNPPLKIAQDKIQIKWLQPFLIFPAKPDSACRFLTGNPDAAAPSFDIAQSVRNPLIGQMPVAELGPLEIKAAAEEKKPVTERYAWVITLLLVLGVAGVAALLVNGMRSVAAQKDE